MAELVAAVPELLRPEQAAQHYAEAVVTAVAACAEDTAGQTCYICYGEGDEDEGLVRGCACRGENGFAHVSCLAQGAQAARVPPLPARPTATLDRDLGRSY